MRRATRILVTKRTEAPRTPTEEEIAVATSAVPDYPVFSISKQAFYARLCKCTRYMIASKCDRQLCSYVNSNTRLFHKVRGLWDPTSRCDPSECDACNIDSPYRSATSSPDQLMRFQLCLMCLPCNIDPNGCPPKPAPTPTSAASSTMTPLLETPLPPMFTSMPPRGVQPPPTGEILRLKGAEKPFKVHAPACVYGRHTKIVLGQ